MPSTPKVVWPNRIAVILFVLSVGLAVLALVLADKQHWPVPLTTITVVVLVLLPLRWHRQRVTRRYLRNHPNSQLD